MFDSRCLAMLEDLIVGDQGIAEKMKTNANSKFAEYTTRMTVDGVDIDAKYSYSIDTDMKSGYQGLVSVSWLYYK